MLWFTFIFMCVQLDLTGYCQYSTYSPWCIWFRICKKVSPICVQWRLDDSVQNQFNFSVFLAYVLRRFAAADLWHRHHGECIVSLVFIKSIYGLTFAQRPFAWCRPNRWTVVVCVLPLHSSLLPPFAWLSLCARHFLFDSGLLWFAAFCILVTGAAKVKPETSQ